MIWEVVDITLEDSLMGKQFVKRMNAIANSMVEFLEKEKCG